MLYSNIPGIDKPVSRLVLGTMWMNTRNLDDAFPVLDAFLAAGGNCFDTAHGYGGGDSERAFGQWIHERGVRDKVVILGKGAHHSQDRKRVTPFDIQSDLHDSLARFKVDSIDLYVLHRDDPDKPIGPIVETLHAAKEAGQINAYGGSNWSAERLQEANEYARRARPDPLRRQQPPVQPGRTDRAAMARLRQRERAGRGGRPRLVPRQRRHAPGLVQPGRRLLQRPLPPRQPRLLYRVV